MLNLEVDFRGLDAMIRAFGGAGTGVREGPRPRVTQYSRDSAYRGSSLVGRGVRAAGTVQAAGPGSPLQVPLEAIVREASFRTLEKVLRFIVGRAQANAPIDTGHLRRSIAGYIGNVKVTGSQASNSKPRITHASNLSVQATVRAEAPYAFFVHEFFLWYEVDNRIAGSVVSRENRGPSNATIKPKLQELTPEGGVGGKFLSRAVERNVSQINLLMKQGFQDALARSLASASGNSVGQVLRALGSRGGAIGGQDLTSDLRFAAQTNLGLTLGGTTGTGNPLEPLTSGVSELDIGNLTNQPLFEGDE